jgi:hypothetical protein
MRSGIAFRLVLLVLLVPPRALGRQISTPSIPDSAKGFDKQYKNLFKAFEKAENPYKAYKEENGQAVLRRLGTFAIPEDWFTHTFGPEEGPKLVKHYSKLFQAFERSTIYEFRRVLDENTAQIHTKAFGARQVNPPKSALVPLAPVQLFRVQHFTAPRSLFDGYTMVPIGRYYSFFFVESFIYLDGSFRFVGTYNCVFWRPCSTNDPVFRDQLVRRDAAP